MATLSPTVLATFSSNFSNNNGTIAPSTAESNLVVGLVVELVIFILMSGNLLMVVTLLLYKPWSIADLLLFSLSMADFINGAVPAQILNLVNNFLGQDRWTSELCAIFIWMTFSLRLISVFTITLISAERMFLLTKPLHHRTTITIRKARLAVLAVWLFAVLIAALPFMGVGKSGFARGYCYYQLYDLGIAYGCIIEAFGILQLVLVLACFIAIRLSSGKFIKRQSVMAAANQTGGAVQESAGTKQVKQLTKMMGIVVILYYISWLPYLMINLVSLIRGHLPHALEILVGFLSLVSAIINPILYGKMSLRYRRGYIFIFKKILSLCGRGDPDGRFFDDKRRGSQAAYSTQSQAMQRASIAVDTQAQHVNTAFEDDENNHNTLNKTSYNNVNYDDDDDDDDDDGENGISIYPVQINQDDDNDDNDETQISIIPFNESVQLSNEQTITSTRFEKSAQTDGENDERVRTGVSEEDISICPLEESIMVHLDDTEKTFVSTHAHDSGNKKATTFNGNNDDFNDHRNNMENENELDSLNREVERRDGNGSESESNSEKNEEQEKEEERDASDSSCMGKADIADYGKDSNGRERFTSSDDEEEDESKNASKKQHVQQYSEASDSSSQSSVTGSYDVLGLLENDNLEQGENGHFFVDEVVKRIEEEEHLRSQLDEDMDEDDDTLKEKVQRMLQSDTDEKKARMTGERKDKESQEGDIEKSGHEVKMDKKHVDDDEEKEETESDDDEEEGEETDGKEESDDDEDEEGEKREKEQEEQEQEKEEEEQKDNELKKKTKDNNNNKVYTKGVGINHIEGAANSMHPSIHDNLDSELEGYTKIMKRSRSAVKKKYTHAISDLLRRELGEI